MKFWKKPASSLRVVGRKIHTHANAFKALFDKLSGDDDIIPFNLAHLEKKWGFDYPRMCFSPVLRLGCKIRQDL